MSKAFTTRIPSDGSVPERQAFREADSDSTSSGRDAMREPRTDENKQQRVVATENVANVIEKLHYEFAALAEPFAKQAVAINFDQSHVRVFGVVADGKLLREGFAERCFACSGRTVEQKNTV